ncbi:hypothetical protein [Acetobacter sp.]|uniref:hypothetical protein n=1 Tax=Acetobacter sp. TaxID=440 RepID=UPI0039EA677A
MTPTPEMIEAAARAICVNNGADPDGNDSDIQSDMGANWRAYSGDAREALKAALAAMWRPIGEHDGTTKHVIGMDKEGNVCSMWYFAPSSLTRNWWRVGGSGKRPEECFPVYFCAHPSIFEDRK